MSVAAGWKKLTATYQCPWCEREETITCRKDGMSRASPEGWQWDVDPQQIGLCSTDCKAVRHRAFVAASASLQHLMEGSVSVYRKEFLDCVERSRKAYLNERKERFLT